MLFSFFDLFPNLICIEIHLVWFFFPVYSWYTVDYSLLVFPNGFCLHLVSNTFLLLFFTNVSWNWYIVIVICIVIRQAAVSIITFLLLLLLVIFAQSVFGDSLFDCISLFLPCLYYSRNVVFVLIVLVLILFWIFLSFLLIFRLKNYESNFLVVDLFRFWDLNSILSFIICVGYCIVLHSFYCC